MFLINNSLGLFLVIQFIRRLWIILFIILNLFIIFFQRKLTNPFCFLYLKSNSIRLFIFLIIKPLLKSILLDMAEQLILYPEAIESRLNFVSTRVPFCCWGYRIILIFYMFNYFLCWWIILIFIFWIRFIRRFLIYNWLLLSIR